MPKAKRSRSRERVRRARYRERKRLEANNEALHQIFADSDVVPKIYDEMESLTSHLRNIRRYSDALIKATQSPFLALAGQGKLPKAVLAKWLKYDLLYVKEYIGFASRFLVNVSELLGEDKEIENIAKKGISLLLEALGGVNREMGFFEDVAKKYELDLSSDGGGEKVRSIYHVIFQHVGNGLLAIPNTELASKRLKFTIHGFVLLWATEYCYLSAWTYASAHSTVSSASTNRYGDDLDGGALRKEFIPNWTSNEFRDFVGRCEDMVEVVWAQLDVAEKREVIVGLEILWREILEVERHFWPDPKGKDDQNEGGENEDDQDEDEQYNVESGTDGADNDTGVGMLSSP